MVRKIFLFAVFIRLINIDSAFAADCAEIGKRVAMQKRGTLTRSIPIVREGKNMCTVVIIVPARDGEKLRRVEITVPSE
ncbi:hypothetical protein [Bartonella sp. F02]|uniref:hypothetical protein n=1 Tax=Bartonella sp. F02 TaxID=2967262 RepID=UPI0022A9905A|nr:hypothetical protein [Bartonella sp. F02]MCZ2328501.1 hypothetical protein [Bartonella sp. F02]